MTNKTLTKFWNERNKLWDDIHRINSPTYHFHEDINSISSLHKLDLWSVTDGVSGHLHRYLKDELRKKLEAAGLGIIMLTCYAFLFLKLFYQIRKFITRKEGIKGKGVL